MIKNQKQPRTYCVSFSISNKGIKVRNEWCRDGLKMFIGGIDVRENQENDFAESENYIYYKSSPNNYHNFSLFWKDELQSIFVQMMKHDRCTLQMIATFSMYVSFRCVLICFLVVVGQWKDACSARQNTALGPLCGDNSPCCRFKLSHVDFLPARFFSEVAHIRDYIILYW